VQLKSISRPDRRRLHIAQLLRARAKSRLMFIMAGARSAAGCLSDCKYLARIETVRGATGHAAKCVDWSVPADPRTILFPIGDCGYQSWAASRLCHSLAVLTAYKTRQATQPSVARLVVLVALYANGLLRPREPRASDEARFR